MGTSSITPELQPLLDYFPALDNQQVHQFRHLSYLYRFWNERINLISRTDIDHLYERHVLHALAIAKFVAFAPETKILDVGTGGGFPGIPLAIMFPDADFHLVDVIQKKTRVVDVIASNLGLRNVTVEHLAADQAPGPYDFAVTRAVADMNSLRRWVAPNISKESRNDCPNGLIALKGGRLLEELHVLGSQVYQFPVSEWFSEPFFRSKMLVYLPL